MEEEREALGQCRHDGPHLLCGRRVLLRIANASPLRTQRVRCGPRWQQRKAQLRVLRAREEGEGERERERERGR